jgi:hypothetical protein
MKKFSVFVVFLIPLAIVLMVRDTGLYNKKLSLYKEFQMVEDQLMKVDNILVQGEEIQDKISQLKKEHNKDPKAVSLLEEKSDALKLKMDEGREFFRSRKQKYLSLVNTYNKIAHPIFLHRKSIPAKLSIHEFKSDF